MHGHSGKNDFENQHANANANVLRLLLFSENSLQSENIFRIKLPNNSKD